MQTNLLWTGREYHSMENCLVNVTDTGIRITSTIIGYYERKLYKVDYAINTNNKWETVFCEVVSRHSDRTQSIRVESDGKGNWTVGGKEANQFDGCMDIDISLTPFTNTLPINRLQLSEHESKQVSVIFLDVLAHRMTPARQKYSRLSRLRYQYENVPNDFEAIIEVDESGFVADYPLLFTRTAALVSNYK